MDLFNQHLYSFILLLIGLVAVIANSMLLWIAYQLINYSLEIKLAMALALADLILALLIICSFCLNNWVYNAPETFKLFCKFKGPTTFLLFYFSLVLIGLIAMERYYKVRSSTIPPIIWFLIIICTATFIVLVALSAIYGEFSASLTGCDCAPLAKNSTLSAIVIFSLGFLMLASVVTALFGYVGVLRFLLQTQARMNHTFESSHKVKIRVLSISLIYLLLIAPAAILIMMEGTNLFMPSELLSLVITTLIALTTIADPCLILFSHSLIFEQLRHSFSAGYSSTHPKGSESLVLVID
ncbi:hypothetical protein DSO57_1004860 [Entomophthora muscae]|uniref:Uncharacterized protein n=1 Tax=Entomophthora muscae TaxID=34485 RepID=A0ACC2RZ97_9FUNG|nr:hypothetical protein DSO57_1004860 [Entomophthora muscae]